MKQVFQPFCAQNSYYCERIFHCSDGEDTSHQVILVLNGIFRLFPPNVFLGQVQELMSDFIFAYHNFIELEIPLPHMYTLKGINFSVNIRVRSSFLTPLICWLMGAEICESANRVGLEPCSR